MDHHEKHTGHATKVEQINSFIGERFVGVISGALLKGNERPDSSIGSITLVFECGWGIVFEDVANDKLWIETPEHLIRTSELINEHLLFCRDNLVQAFVALRTPQPEETEIGHDPVSVSEQPPTNKEAKPVKPKAKKKRKAKGK
jgi:hypothetical protein